MSKFEFKPNAVLKDVLEITAPKYSDQRGFFCESFRYSEFKKAGIPPFIQENHSFSKAGTFRGLHYQIEPKAQGKLVYCVSGKIRDYVVDIRKGSPNYGEWIQFGLDGGDHAQVHMVYVPPGFAHGFYVDGFNSAHVIYKVTEYWSPECERSVRWNDPEIGIELDDDCLRMSEKDMNAPLLKDAENNFVYEG